MGMVSCLRQKNGGQGNERNRLKNIFVFHIFVCNSFKAARVRPRLRGDDGMSRELMYKQQIPAFAGMTGPYVRQYGYDDKRRRPKSL